jgi:hypothetical protein
MDNIAAQAYAAGRDTALLSAFQIGGVPTEVEMLSAVVAFVRGFKSACGYERASQRVDLRRHCALGPLCRQCGARSLLARLSPPGYTQFDFDMFCFAEIAITCDEHVLPMMKVSWGSAIAHWLLSVYRGLW